MLTVKFLIYATVSIALAGMALSYFYYIAPMLQRSADVENIAKALYNFQNGRATMPVPVRTAPAVLYPNGTVVLDEAGAQNAPTYGLLVGDCPLGLRVKTPRPVPLLLGRACWFVPPRLHGGALYVYYATANSTASAYTVELIDTGLWDTPYGRVKVYVAFVKPAG